MVHIQFVGALFLIATPILATAQQLAPGGQQPQGFRQQQRRQQQGQQQQQEGNPNAANFNALVTDIVGNQAGNFGGAGGRPDLSEFGGPGAGQNFAGQGPNFGQQPGRQQQQNLDSQQRPQFNRQNNNPSAQQPNFNNINNQRPQFNLPQQQNPPGVNNNNQRLPGGRPIASSGEGDQLEHDSQRQQGGGNRFNQNRGPPPQQQPQQQGGPQQQPQNSRDFQQLVGEIVGNQGVNFGSGGGRPDLTEFGGPAPGQQFGGNNNNNGPQQQQGFNNNRQQFNPNFSNQQRPGNFGGGLRRQQRPGFFGPNQQQRQGPGAFGPNQLQPPGAFGRPPLPNNQQRNRPIGADFGGDGPAANNDGNFNNNNNNQQQQQPLPQQNSGNFVPGQLQQVKQLENSINGAGSGVSSSPPQLPNQQQQPAQQSA